jgi:hypothetical protein
MSRITSVLSIPRQVQALDVAAALNRLRTSELLSEQVVTLCTDAASELLDPLTRYLAPDRAVEGVHAITGALLADTIATSGWTLHDVVLDGQISTVEAVRAHARLLVGIVGDEVSLDVSGLTDSSCDGLVEEILTAARERGLDLADPRTVEHRDVDGGSLITAAAERHEATLARGLHSALTEATQGGTGRPAAGAVGHVVTTASARRAARAARAPKGTTGRRRS